MMKKLFLTSYFANTAELLPPFAGDCHGKTVCFIPTAAIPETVDFYVGEGAAALAQLGMVVDILDVAAEGSERIAAKLQSNDCIYVSGGNTFFLMQELRKKQADQMLLAQINAGKLYIGESAGAMILAPMLDYAAAMDDASVAPPPTWAGLNAVAIYPLPHHTEYPFAEATAKIIEQYANQRSLYPINNAQVILMRGNQVQISHKAA